MPEIIIDEYDYVLPTALVAQYPLPQRDSGKLLLLKQNKPLADSFANLPLHLPENSVLIMNNTRVFPARLVFHKPSGTRIEIFCLESITSASNHAAWRCFVGNAKKWKDENLKMAISLSEGNEIVLTAKKISREGETYIIQFVWQGMTSFFDILEILAAIPLPPYIKRNPESSDRLRYQTVYAQNNGSVAAPTAGLHFTEEIFRQLAVRNIIPDYLTLHVGAGTFKPVKTNTAEEHEMHPEKISVGINLIKKLSNNNSHITAVGTTTLRSLETIYWLGVKISLGITCNETLLEQWEWKSLQKQALDSKEAFSLVYDYMKKNNLDEILGYSRLMIVPGYKVKTAHFLITNFHQPRSTLLLLIAAFTGQGWRDAYDFAISNEFRFLSYGDCCLFSNQSR